MRKYLFLVAALAFGSISAAGPASATDQSTAVQLCAKNPSCLMIRGNGGVNLSVGNTEIWCPNQGSCEILTRTASTLGGIRAPWGFTIKRHVTPVPQDSLSSSGDSAHSSSGGDWQPAPGVPGQIN